MQKVKEQMQTVIDISKEVKNRLGFGVTYSQDIQAICEAIGNSVPLADILDRIKAEIDLETRVEVQHYTNANAVIDAVLDVIEENMTEIESQKSKQ